MAFGRILFPMWELKKQKVREIDNSKFDKASGREELIIRCYLVSHVDIPAPNVREAVEKRKRNKAQKRDKPSCLI